MIVTTVFSLITHCWCFYLDVYAYIEVLLKLQLKCLILGVYTCFYLVGNWHIEAFQEIEEEISLRCCGPLSPTYPSPCPIVSRLSVLHSIFFFPSHVPCHFAYFSPSFPYSAPYY